MTTKDAYLLLTEFRISDNHENVVSMQRSNLNIFCIVASVMYMMELPFDILTIRRLLIHVKSMRK